MEDCTPIFEKLQSDTHQASPQGDGPGRESADDKHDVPQAAVPDDVEHLLDCTPDDAGNADCMHALYGDLFLFCEALGWLWWSGVRWESDADAAVERSTVDVLRRRHDAACREIERLTASLSESDHMLVAQCNGYKNAALRARRAGQHEQAKRLEAYAAATAQARAVRDAAIADMRRIRGCIAVFQSLVTVDAARFDSDPWRFNCQNGTLDMHTGELLPHRRDDFIRQLAPLDFDPHAACPTFERFIFQIMCERPELVDYLQRVLGMALVGEQLEQIWFLAHGGGGNGKSTAFNCLAEVLGSYAAAMDPATLGGTRNGGAASPDIAALAGKRLVIVSESDRGFRLSDSMMKRMTGGDAITARTLYRQPFTFPASWLLCMFSNNRPQVRDTTAGFWRRVRYLPFDWQPASDAEKDRDLPQKLRAEATGTLTWLVRGCLAWQREGLDTPEVVKAATAEYERSENIVSQFLADCCWRSADAYCGSTPLYQQYVEWAKETAGEKPMSQRAFARELQQLGFVSRHTETGNRWHGLRLRTPADPLDQEGDTPQDAAASPNGHCDPSPLFRIGSDGKAYDEEHWQVARRAQGG